MTGRQAALSQGPCWEPRTGLDAASTGQSQCDGALTGMTYVGTAASACPGGREPVSNWAWAWRPRALGWDRASPLSGGLCGRSACGHHCSMRAGNLTGAGT